jgi:hypothetical protein
MLASGKETLLDRILRIGCVPQEMESPLVKHGQIPRHNIVEFLSMLGRETRSNRSLTFNERFKRRHKVPPFQATQRT